MKERSVLVENISTAAITDPSTTVYTVPKNTRAKWVLVHAANHTGSSISGLDVEISNSVLIPVMGSKTLTAGEVIDYKGSYVMLESGYEIRARADTIGVSLILTLEEITTIAGTA